MTLAQDIRIALRLFRRNPSTTAIALISIALSVAASSVVFAAIKSVLLAPLPYSHSHELVQIRTEFGELSEPSIVDYGFPNDAEEIARRTRTLESVAIYGNALYNLADGGSTPPEALYGLRVSANLFSALGVKPMLGRNILPEEDQLGHANEMILSYGLWVRRFNSDRNIVGRSIDVDGHDCLVIGVMPPEFNFPLRRAAAHTPSPYVEFWAPIHITPVDPEGALGVVAKLRKGVSLREAQDDLASITADLRRQFPATDRGRTLRLAPLRDRMLGNAGRYLWLLMGASCMFLLIGCANLANLLLARGVARQREIAIRMAVGANKRRIVRQLLTESCILAVLGGVAGYAITVAAWKILPAIAPRNIPRLAATSADWKVLSFSVGIAVLTGLLFGIVPALRAQSVPAIAARDGHSLAGVPDRHDRTRGLLVLTEVAATVTLVIVGGQLLTRFIELLHTDPGFDTGRVLASVVVPSPVRYRTPEQKRQVYQRFLDAIGGIPGVESAGTVDALPFSGENHGGLITNDPAGVMRPDSQIVGEVDLVSSDYLQTMGVHLLEGRWFRQNEMNVGSNSVIVSDSAASLLSPHADPIGKRICVYCTPENPNNWKQVIGVVSSMHHRSIDGPPQQMNIYLAAGALEQAAFLVVKTSHPIGSLEKAIRIAIAAVDPNQPVFLSASMKTLIADSLADRRFIMVLLAVTALLALVISAAGVYGVVSYTTSRRIPEIGVRMALGASRANVQILMFRQGFVVVAAGLVTGCVLTQVLLRVLRGVIAGLGIESWIQFGLPVLLVSVTAAAACWLPVRRAARVDPMVALRYE
jgi:predicted permease